MADYPMPGPSEFSVDAEQAMRLRNRNQIPRAGESADSIEIRRPLPNDRNSITPDNAMGARLDPDQQQDI